jgi:pimeloyl-ACP methyl ester carboxylesterase
MTPQLIALMLISVFLLAAAFVFLLGQRAKARLRATYPPPGQMVDVGGYRLHIQRQGQGGPTVIIDAGQGDFSLTWNHLLPEIAHFTQVVAYDRAGLGWSDPSPQPRTAAVMVEELQTLLKHANLPGPYILVGASTGGMNVRLFAHRYPAEVAGMVLVDAAHEEQFSAPIVKATLERMSKMMPLMMGLSQGLVRSGLAALRPGLLPDASGARQKLPETAVPVYDALLTGSAKHLAAAAAELQGLDETHAQLRAANITSLGDIPLIVLRHGQEQPMMVSPEVTAALEETFERLQHEMAGLSSNGRLVVAEQSGHAIHLDQPELVIIAIKEVVMAARKPAQVVDESMPFQIPDGNPTGFVHPV